MTTPQSSSGVEATDPDHLDRFFYTTDYQNALPVGNKLARVTWTLAYLLLFRLSPVSCFAWRRVLLRLFGAKLASDAKVYPSTRIWAPWNLTMEHRSCLGPEVYCYSVDRVFLGVDSTVSFRTFLCTASHDISDSQRPLVTGPIRLDRGALVFADAFIGMNVTVGEGAVVAARAVVVRSVEPLDVVGGNPARVISRRAAPA
jgi:putative colanic acid biosynthesis acetyltransferase WcaF